MSLTEIEGREGNFKDSQGYLEVVSTKTGDVERFAKVLRVISGIMQLGSWWDFRLST